MRGDDLELVHRNGLRLLKLVNTLLEFARIEAGRAQATFEPTDLGSFVAETASTFRSAMEHAGLQFILDCPSGGEAAYIDRSMWEKIVLNLVSNAFKATLSGYVKVSVRLEGEQFAVAVEDSGIGIPAGELPKMFERFHRVEGARGRSHEGSGIGLAFVHELVKLHEGTITVESAPGSGTTFTVRVPKGSAHLPQERIQSGANLGAPDVAASYVSEAMQWLPAESRPIEQREVFASDSVQAPHKAQANARILLADDNADMRAYVKHLLAREYTVEEVSNGAEALERVRISRPDLVLTDVMMPELDGFGLLQALRAQPATSTIPVILLSARAGEDARVEGLQAGADDYIVKPFTARELLARVGSHVALSRLRHEHAKRERALRAESDAAKEQAVIILESISDSFMSVDDQWRFTFVNAEAERTLAIPRAELLGQTYWEVFPHVVGTEVEDYLRRAAKEGISTSWEHLSEPRQRWYDIRVYPSQNRGISIYFRDVTERKNAEDALRESEDRFRALADNISQLAWMADRNGDRFWYNRRWVEFTGMTAEEARGLGWKEVHDPAHVERVISSYERAIATGTDWEEMCPLRGKDGEFRWFLIRAVPIRDENGAVTRWFGTNTDITERVQTSEALKRSEKIAATGRLAATVAHELNNPLTIAINLVYLAQREPDSTTAKKYLSDAERELQRVARLANRTLSFYRKKRRNTWESIRVAEFIEELADIYQNACLTKNIHTEVRASSELTIVASKDEMAQVITNLLSNAVDAAGQDGNITIRCKSVTDPKSRRRMAAISVIDSGHGIPKKHRSSLFEPFFTTKRDTGTGLGLWISKEIVEKHGGNMRVLSRTHGKLRGTVVTVLLPVDRRSEGRRDPWIGQHRSTA